ncbi:MAG: hypothetical protein GC131_07720 [Alphaproteobacteria bacterium]|nr:hypothetical protein [Alphaproteobacteria bacterium]
MKITGFTALFLAAALAAAPAWAMLDDEIIIEDEAAMDLDTMGAARGAAAENSAVSTQTLAATATGNTVSVTGDLVTGSINIGDNFGGSGFGSYVNNTGNNTAINSAVSVNIQMLPGTP